MAAAVKYYKIIDPRSSKVDITDNDSMNQAGGLYGNYTWYSRLLQGSPNRLTRYREYDLMDNDVDVARALDIIAEEIVGNNPKTEMPLQVFIMKEGREIPNQLVVTLNAALKSWCIINQWQHYLFTIARHTVKYGDCFFRRPKKKMGKMEYIPIKNVIGAVVSEMDFTDVRGWHIKVDSKHANQQAGGSNLFYNVGASIGDAGVQPFNSEDILRFTLNDDMSEEAPFGSSILRAAYRTFKQKELLEDSLIIYRIVRAPERLVFKIPTGKMPPQRAAQHLEQIKNEITQKKVPSASGGGDSVESIYHPHSMSKNYFFAQPTDGPGASVEVLPGGAGLGELADLEYFFKKMWRGLRIPQSYMDNTTEGGAVANDGKVGIAYLQEIKFALYIERLQRFLERVFDEEFKRFLYDAGIIVDPTLFKIILPQPSNWATSKQQQMDSELINTYGQVDGIKHISKRFALGKYLQLTEAEIALNERQLAEERGLNPDKITVFDLPKIYSPEDAEAGGFEGGLGGMSGGGGGGPPDGGELDLEDGEMGDEITDDPELDGDTDPALDDADSPDDNPPENNKTPKGKT